MEIFQTRDSGLIATLTKDVQDLHVALYPEYFKNYDYEEIAAFFETVVHRPEHFMFAVREH